MDQQGKNQTDKQSDYDFPETTYVRDIENKVFQSLVVRTLSEIKDISFVEGNIIDNLFNIGEGIKGIWVEQESKNQSVAVRIELNIAYGISIPDKATEIQTKITKEITNYTGLHVSSVHVIFKNIILEESIKKAATPENPKEPPTSTKDLKEDSFINEHA